jgi:hypothetical protein
MNAPVGNVYVAVITPETILDFVAQAMDGDTKSMVAMKAAVEAISRGVERDDLVCGACNGSVEPHTPPKACGVYLRLPLGKQPPVAFLLCSHCAEDPEASVILAARAIDPEIEVVGRA